MWRAVCAHAAIFHIILAPIYADRKDDEYSYFSQKTIYLQNPRGGERMCECYRCARTCYRQKMVSSYVDSPVAVMLVASNIHFIE